MSQNQDTNELHSINKRFISDNTAQDLPAVTLPDGSKVQTGTVGALLMNIKMYDRVCAGEDIEGVTKAQLEHFLTVPIATLAKIGMFDLFTVDEWIAGGGSAGRQFVGVKAKEMGY